MVEADEGDLDSEEESMDSKPSGEEEEIDEDNEE